MAQFEEPEVLATFDRSYGSKHEELRFERGEYNGRPTYTLRLYWRADDGTWRWSAQKPTQSGKTWERMNLKAKELQALGEALMAEAAGTRPAAEPRGTQPRPNTGQHREISGDAELDGYPF